MQIAKDLMPHQKQAVAFAEKRAWCSGIFMEPGTGKTLVGISAIQLFQPALIVCRRDDFLTWLTELDDCWLHRDDVCLVTCGASYIHNPPCPVTIVTYDLIKNPEVFASVRSLPFKVCILDESQLVKNWKTLRTKAVIAATRHIPRRLALSGTPITNQVEDIYSQALYIDKGRSFGTDYWRFKTAHYQKLPTGGWYLRRHAREAIKHKIEQFAFVVKTKEVLKLPPLWTVIKSCPMGINQRHIYEKLIKDWELPNDITLNEVTTRILKLRQVACGFYYDKAGNPKNLENPKLDVLKEVILEEGHKKLVVYCTFKAELARVYTYLRREGIECIPYVGSPTMLETARKSFHTQEKYRVFLCQVDRAMGMNELCIADAAVYMSNSVKVASRLQSIARVYRKGSEQHKRVVIYDVCAEDTIDLSILQALKNKVNLAKEILSLAQQNTRKAILKGFINGRTHTYSTVED